MDADLLFQVYGGMHNHIFILNNSGWLSKCNCSGTLLVPPAAAGEEKEGSEGTSRSGRGTQSPCTPC